MASPLTPERIAEMLLELAVARLQEGATPISIEEDLIGRGAQPDVAKLLVSKALESIQAA